MAAISVRDIPDEAWGAFKARATANGTTAEAMIRQWVIAQAESPMRYGFKALGPGSAKATLERYSDHPNGVGGGATNLDQAQYDAYQRAKLLMARGAAGDREEARQVLAAVFDDVFTV